MAKSVFTTYKGRAGEESAPFSPDNFLSQLEPLTPKASFSIWKVAVTHQRPSINLRHTPSKNSHVVAHGIYEAYSAAENTRASTAELGSRDPRDPLQVSECSAIDSAPTRPLFHCGPQRIIAES